MSKVPECVVVTASNDAYLNSLLRMLKSIRPANLPIGLLDLGLSEHNKQRVMQTYGGKCIILDPGWCVALSDQEDTPDYKKVFLAKPFIPSLFPGYSTYLWVDADVVFLDCSAVADFLQAAHVNGIAVCYEDHPLYRTPPRKSGSSLKRYLSRKSRSYKEKRLRQYFGQQISRRWRDTPTLNSGIFCLKGSSPAWHHWQQAMFSANLTGQIKKHLICDQTCLDFAVLSNELNPAKMPATHNWCLSLAQPLVCKTTGHLLDPMPPHPKIKVLHCMGPDKIRPLQILRDELRSASCIHEATSLGSPI
jgi:hypothetical protein